MLLPSWKVNPQRATDVCRYVSKIKMDKMLKRYWFKSEKGLGIGVTAYNVKDAKSLIMAEDSVMVFTPHFDSYIENIDIQELDQNHVIPNMGIVVDRGIWYPNIGS